MLTEEEGGTLYSATERMLPRHPFGAVDTSQLLHLLSQHGLLDARVEETPRGVIIHLVHPFLCSLFFFFPPLLLSAAIDPQKDMRCNLEFFFRFLFLSVPTLAERGQRDPIGGIQHARLLPRRGSSKDAQGHPTSMHPLFVM